MPTYLKSLIVIIMCWILNCKSKIILSCTKLNTDLFCTSLYKNLVAAAPSAPVDYNINLIIIINTLIQVMWRCWCLWQDFDRLASQRVQSMLDEVDVVMYDPPLSRPEPTHLANECRDWTSAFPHIWYAVFLCRCACYACFPPFRCRSAVSVSPFRFSEPLYRCDVPLYRCRFA